MTGRPGSLFHTIVIIGASLGCGGSVTKEASPSAGDAGPEGGRIATADSVGCSCDPTVAVGAPSDCSSTTQFTCNPPPAPAVGFPYTGWFAFADCRCDPTPPLSLASCGDAGSMHGGPILGCTYSNDCPGTSPGAVSVPFACKCLPGPIPIQ